MNRMNRRNRAKSPESPKSGAAPAAFAGISCLGGPPRGGKNRGQLSSFVQQRFQFRCGQQAGFLQQLQPENCFVCFFCHDADLGDKISSRPRSARSAIVGRDRCPRAQYLLPDHIRLTTCRQMTGEPNDSQRELLCPLPQLLVHFYSHSPFPRSSLCLPDFGDSGDHGDFGDLFNFQVLPQYSDVLVASS